MIVFVSCNKLTTTNDRWNPWKAKLCVVGLALTLVGVGMHASFLGEKRNPVQQIIGVPSPTDSTTKTNTGPGVPIKSISWNVSSWPEVLDREWCRRKRKTPGLIYVKIPKTGSSTMVGINIRVARKIGRQESRNCSYSETHGRSYLLDRQAPFMLWSSIRDPASRALSEFYHFHVSRHGVEPTESHVKEMLARSLNYQFLYLADHPHPELLMDPNKTNTLEENFELIKQYVLKAYHFVGLLERKYESFAVLKLLWGLESEDLIVLDAKHSGGYDGGGYNSTCLFIQSAPKPLPPWLDEYIEREFKPNNLDYLLYDVINQTLDRTVQNLGMDLVDQEVQKLKSLQSLAEQSCQAKAIFPCSADGESQAKEASRDCYRKDSGCGYRCVNEVLTNTNVSNVLS